MVHYSTIIYIIVLTLLLELPSPPQEWDPVPGPWAICKHLLAFTILGFLVELGRVKKSMLFWLGILFLYSIGTEVLQWVLHPICNRYFDLQDILHDVVGVLLGTFIGHVCRPLVKRPTESNESLDKIGENH